MALKPDAAAEADRGTGAWEGRSLSGTALPSGVYVCVLEARAPDGQQARRVCPVRLAR